MKYQFTMQRGLLRADLLDRETAEETRAFLAAVVLASINHRCSSILVHVRLSNPLFTVETHGVLRSFKKIASDPSHRIALLGDTLELGMSHDYVSLLGQQQGINLRSFKTEAEAVEWLKPRLGPEERRRQKIPPPRGGKRHRRPHPAQAALGLS